MSFFVTMVFIWWRCREDLTAWLCYVRSISSAILLRPCIATSVCAVRRVTVMNGSVLSYANG